MLVKIEKDRFLNTDHIQELARDNNGKVYQLMTTNGLVYDLSPIAAGYLLEVMEVSQAIILPGEVGYADKDAPAAQPLTSRIAQLLRDTFVQGATTEEITEALNGTYSLIDKAIFSLVCENVVIGNAETGRYFHATHAPRTTPPPMGKDLLLSDPAILASGTFQCISCEHASCNNCASQGVCCQCEQPAFTSRQGIKHTVHTVADVAIPERVEFLNTNNFKQHPATVDKKFTAPNCTTCGNIASAPVHDPQYGNHLFNEPLKTNPDLSVASAAQASRLAEYNESLASRTIENLCDLCGYPYSNQIHLNNCVPLGVME